MNLFAEIRGLVTDSLAALAAEGVLPAGLDYAQVAVEPPRDAAHGDMATNAAMVLAKPAGLAPARDCRGAGGAACARSAHRRAPKWRGRGF